MRKTLADIRAEQIEALQARNPFIEKKDCECYNDYECKCVVTDDLEFECDDCIEDKCVCNENTEE